MTNGKTVKRVVVHPKLNLAVGGKLQRIPVGTEIELTLEQVKALGDKVADPSNRKALAPNGELVEAGGNAELDAAKKRIADLEDQSAIDKKRIADLEAALKVASPKGK